MAERLPEFDAQRSAEQIRRRMLSIARIQGNINDGRWVPAGNFLAAADDRGHVVGGEDEAAGHLDFLLGHGLLEEWSPVAVGAGRPLFRQRRFKLSNKGARLWAEEIDPIPGIADARFGDR